MSHETLIFVLAKIAQEFTTFGLIFGGCCSNALTLELITSQFPPAGSLVTFAQFLLVSLVGLRKQLVVLPIHVPRSVALKNITLELQTIKNSLNDGASLRIVVQGPSSRVANDFAQDLSVSVKLEFAGVEAVLANEDAGLESESSRGQIVSETSSKVAACVVADILVLPATTSSRGNLKERRVTIKIVPENADLLNYLSNPAADILVDLSKPSLPAIRKLGQSHFTFNPLRVRLKPRRIPLMRYAIQVLLFLLISLLNNAAFAYHVPMAVHIIFRSGGLVVNMLMGWLLEKRQYSKLQVLSVMLVTAGVGLTTLSSKQSKSGRVQEAAAANFSANSSSYSTYAMGILILTLALILSGFLGLSQDKTFEQYGRGNWEEAMFYLHALALPLFGFAHSELRAQINTANAGPSMEVGLHSLLPIGNISSGLPPLPFLPVRSPTFRIPSFYIPLFLNVLTQFVCVSGVNRLTSRMNSLTVALVLVVRKAVSLAISVLVIGRARGNMFLWSGAAAVLIGTIGYTIGSRQVQKQKED